MGNVSDELNSIRNLACDRLLIASGLAAIPVTAISCFRATVVGWVPVLSLFVLLALTIITIAIFLQRMTLRAKGTVIISFLFAIGFGGMAQFGLLAASVAFLVMPPVFSAVLLDRRTTALTMAGVATAVTGLAAHALLSPPPQGIELANFAVSPINWLNEACSLLFIAGAMAFAFQGFTDALISALLKARHGQNELKAALVSLADLAEYRDGDTGEHVLRVARIATEIALSHHECGDGSGYPGLEEHRGLHAEMLAEVEELQRRFVVQSAGIGGELSQFLAMWRVNHIMSEDRQYRPYIIAEPVTAAPVG